jgi:aminoglycoside phosphotransferase (APT) family kinase protein
MSAQAGTAIDDFGGLIDWSGLNAWIAGQDVPGAGAVSAARKLAGGVQNNVFLLERGGESLVLRRPSKHLRANSNETMLREARILNALAGSAAVIGACFYLMSPLEGFAPSGQLPGRYATDATWRRGMGEEMVRAAAALAGVDPAAVGLQDLGKPDDWHERQVGRWRSQLDGYRSVPNYDAGGLPHVDEVGRWLSDHLPQDRRIGLIHGDLQFANVLFSQHSPRISGVVDWELATLGDPLLDLGWVLGSWWEKGDPDGKRPLVAPWEDFMSRADLAGLYGESTGRSLGDLPWYFALACYKLACLLEGTYARSRAGQMPAHIGEQIRGYAIWQMRKAAQIIAS